MLEAKQMRLDAFLKMYGMGRKYAYQVIRRRDDPLPAYKQGKYWYVDIEKYEAWRGREHQRCYKYADGQCRAK